MKRRVGLVGVAVIALLALPLRAQATPYGLQRGLDDVVSAAAVGTQAEVHNGAAVWRGRSGVAELGSPRPVPLTGQFRIGSITKTFLATVTLQLVDEKLLRLDDPVARWLPGLPTNGATVRQLMNHTSGLYDVLYTLPRPPQPEFYANRYRTWTNDELIQRALANPPTSKPGPEYKYSNTNYLVLAKIVEKVTGHTYAFEIEHRLIRPLHLHDTSVPGTSPRIPGPHAHGYVPTPDGQLLDFTSMNPSLFGAAGEMISSTKDLDRFMTALLGGDLLPPALLHQMKTPGTENGHYGLGLARKTTTCGTTVYGNDGDALAYQAWSYATEDLHRRATLFVTPTFTTNPDPAVDAFLDKAFCD
ncbi:serine hydrolase domain-containing protein [Kribbella sp. NPDC058245]|uniref:serine hydrolase domain-containing protein n=1 Tax=Kribbella sp. NPDC058245 TaxID=3346399 RepID=UPI0036ED0EAB